LAETLPVYQLQIYIVTELITQPQYIDSTSTYEFEGTITGFYSDPVSQAKRTEKAFRASQTRTTNQYFYADKILSGSYLRPQSKLFIDGYYTFPSEETREPGYLDLLNVSFNSTNRSVTESSPNVKSTSVGSARRRNVLLKATPRQEFMKASGSITPSKIKPLSDSFSSPPSAQATSSISIIVSFTSLPGNDSQSDLTAYLEDSDIDRKIGCISPTDTMKRHHLQDTTTTSEPPSKRQRKPSQRV
jgi:hypothetical protein